MFYIHAIGAELAPTEISKELRLSLCNSSESSIAGVKATRSILNKDYLIETKNKNPALARENCQLTVAELAAKASRNACESAGLAIDNSDLLLADTLTPWQITPSEAQRIAYALGLKITSFDIGSSGVSFPMLLQICRDWGELAQEQQLLLCAVHAPTIYTDYSNGIEGALFSDAAVTMVLGRERKGYELLAIEQATIKLVDPGLNFSPFHLAKASPEFIKHAAKDCIVASCSGALKPILQSENITICVNDYGVDLSDSLKEMGLDSQVQQLNIFSQFGDSIGCVPGIGMWQWSKTASVGDVFIGFSPGCGQHSGAFAVKKI